MATDDDSTRFKIIRIDPELQKEMSRDVFGMTKEDALAQNICIQCKRVPTFSSDAGRREYQISGVCEPCFDAMFPEEEDDE